MTDLNMATALAEVDTDSLPDAASLTESGAMRHTQSTRGWVGSPLYMAPEQWQGQTAGAATDIYAVGLILYEMLAGRPAADGRDIASLAKVHRSGNLRPLQADLPAAVAALLQRCLAVAPAARYATWAELATMLTAVIEAETGAAAPLEVGLGELSRAERVALGWSHNSLGMSYADIGKPKEAESHLQYAIRAGEKSSEPYVVSAALSNLSIVYARIGKLQRSVDFLEQALATTRKAGIQEKDGKLLLNLGLIYRQKGEFEKAVDYLEQSLTVMRKVKDFVRDALGRTRSCVCDYGRRGKSSSLSRATTCNY